MSWTGQRIERENHLFEKGGILVYIYGICNFLFMKRDREREGEGEGETPRYLARESGIPKRGRERWEGQRTTQLNRKDEGRYIKTSMNQSPFPFWRHMAYCGQGVFSHSFISSRSTGLFVLSLFGHGGLQYAISTALSIRKKECHGL